MEYKISRHTVATTTRTSTKERRRNPNELWTMPKTIQQIEHLFIQTFLENV
jgi:hypothetical protein